MFDLPYSITVDGVEIPIDTDYRTALTCLVMFNEYDLLILQSKSEYKRNMLQEERVEICLEMFLGEAVTGVDVVTAFNEIINFLNLGEIPKESTSNKPILMDWKQDEMYIFSAISKLYGKDVRTLEYMHFWEFMGYFMEIGESTLSTIQGIRRKLAKKGEKLDKWEREYYNEHRDKIVLKNEKLRKDLIFDQMLGM